MRVRRLRPRPDCRWRRQAGAHSRLRRRTYLGRGFRHGRSGDQTFIVEARAVRGTGERWLGLFELTRCRTVEAIEEWTLDDGSVIRVLRSEVEAHPGDEVRFWFEYLSACLMSDHECLAAESARLWPRVEALVERHRASKVFVGAEDCKRSSRTVIAARKADGRWDTPWGG